MTTATTQETKMIATVIVASQISWLPVRTEYRPFWQSCRQTSAFSYCNRTIHLLTWDKTCSKPVGI